MYNQQAKILQERKWWAELYALAEQEDVKGFYQKYAEYLEWNNVISPNRKTLLKMAKLVAGDDDS